MTDFIRSTPAQRGPLTGWLLFLLGLCIGILGERQWFTTSMPSDRIPRQALGGFQLMAQAWNTIDQHYVDRSAVRVQPMTYGAIAGMVVALGDTDHSTFLTPELVRKTRELESGKLQGIGMEVRSEDGHVVVAAPVDDSPAARAGVHSGDIILAVDGKPVAGLSLNEVVSRIAGPAGTSVSLRLFDPAQGGVRELHIERAVIAIPSVTWRQLPGTELAHVRVADFSRGADKQLRAALGDVERQHLKGVVLDLRDNPGGLLEEAIAVASEFLSGGNVVLMKNRKGKITALPVIPKGEAKTMPLAILINHRTASGAEVVAGALKDHGRGPLIGVTTFGTGTVLSEFQLSDGSALLLAVDEWLTPDGHTFWHKGIAPNIAIPLSSPSAVLRPLTEENLTTAQLRNTKDVQLKAAIDALSRGARADAAKEE